jgi:hypothetical protein
LATPCRVEKAWGGVGQRGAWGMNLWSAGS